MKNNLILILFLVSTTVKAQYSKYYNVDINQNVNVSGSVYEHKTITTIDYGILRLANAQNEKNRLENLKYSDERQRLISLEIAADPIKAYDYGNQNTFLVKGQDAKQFGFVHFTMSYRIPNNALFVSSGAGRLENVSSNGITTEIIINAPLYNKKKDTIDVEKIAKMESVIIGSLNEKIGPESKSIFVHQKEIGRGTVFGVKGFEYTLIWEDDYEYTITDNFISHNPLDGNGITYSVKVRTYGDKNKITFEELEGRRYYLKLLIEKLISTAKVYEITY